MPYIEVSNNLLQVGKPVREDALTQSNENLKDHETRVANLEQSQLKFNIANFIFFSPTQVLSQSGEVAIWMTQAQNDFEIVTAIITNFTDPGGGNGNIECDIRKGATPDPDLAVSIFTTRPSVASGSGDWAVSNNAAFSTQQVLQNEWLFVVVTEIMTGQKSFHFQCYGEV